jgi:2-keto-3-deoxy-L-rhamnonate aldolase RhmA
LKTKLAAGKSVLGIWSILPSATLTELLGYSGFDFQIFDMEHGTYDLDSVADGIRAAEAAGCSPLVRVPGRDPFTIQPILDAGAHGVVIPQVRNAQEAREIVSHMLFSPEGTRGYNPFTRVSKYCPPATLPSGKLDNSFPFIFLIIETESAFLGLDEILAIPRLDGIYLGVYDMSIALGCNGDTGHPRIEQFVRQSVSKARQFKKSVGLMVRSDPEIVSALDAGTDVLVFGVDSFLIRSVASNAVQSFRELARMHRGTQ